MFGYDTIAVLPILLLVAAFGGLIAIASVAYIEAISRSCRVCGVEFIGARDLREHMKDHDKVLSTKKLVSRGRFKKAA